MLCVWLPLDSNFRGGSPTNLPARAPTPSDHAARDHVTIINTARHAIKAAGLPIDCSPHGLRKTLGRRMADDGCTAHEIMAVLGHTTLAEAERYTRDADRRRGDHQGIAKLKSRTNSQTSLDSGKIPERKGKTMSYRTPWRSLGERAASSTYEESLWCRAEYLSALHIGPRANASVVPTLIESEAARKNVPPDLRVRRLTRPSPKGW